jgi:hypothetical protein
MDSAFVRNAATGAPLAPGPLQFVRLPEVGELIWAPPNFWSVVQVVHAWNGPNSPVTELRVTPGTSQLSASPTHVAPF